MSRSSWDGPRAISPRVEMGMAGRATTQEEGRSGMAVAASVVGVDMLRWCEVAGLRIVLLCSLCLRRTLRFGKWIL